MIREWQEAKVETFNILSSLGLTSMHAQSELYIRQHTSSQLSHVCINSAITYVICINGQQARSGWWEYTYGCLWHKPNQLWYKPNIWYISTTEQSSTIDIDMSIDKQIPVEVPVSVDPHPILSTSNKILTRWQ